MVKNYDVRVFKMLSEDIQVTATEIREKDQLWSLFSKVYDVFFFYTFPCCSLEACAHPISKVAKNSSSCDTVSVVMGYYAD
jgi:hypothetical protein